jgi:hypothetical protein
MKRRVRRCAARGGARCEQPARGFELCCAHLHVQVQAAALQRIAQLAGVVGREDHQRRRLRADGADLGDRDLVVGQDLEQQRLERLFDLSISSISSTLPPDCSIALQQRPLDAGTRGSSMDVGAGLIRVGLCTGNARAGSRRQPASAAATARFAITGTRLARYSAEPCRS